MADKVIVDALGRQYTYQNGQRVFLQVTPPTVDDISVVTGSFNKTKNTIDIAGIRYNLTKVGAIT